MAYVSRGFRGKRAKEREDTRLPPGQYLVDDFPVLSAGPTPLTPLDEWTFTIESEVAELKRWSWEAFRALPTEEVHADIHCVTNWSKLDTTSGAGTITRGYDDLDRLTSEIQANAASPGVQYTYWDDGTRRTMTVPGQTQVTYGYNNAGQLTSLTQGSTVVSLGYFANGTLQTPDLRDQDRAHRHPYDQGWGAGLQRVDPRQPQPGLRPRLQRHQTSGDAHRQHVRRHLQLHLRRGEQAQDGRGTGSLRLANLRLRQRREPHQRAGEHQSRDHDHVQRGEPSSVLIGWHDLLARSGRRPDPDRSHWQLERLVLLLQLVEPAHQG